MPHDALCELLTGVIGRVLFQEPPQEIAAPRDRVADREGKLVAKRVVIHRRRVLFCIAASAGCQAPLEASHAQPSPAVHALSALMQLSPQAFPFLQVLQHSAAGSAAAQDATGG